MKCLPKKISVFILMLFLLACSSSSDEAVAIQDDVINSDELIKFLPVDSNSILPIDFVIKRNSDSGGDGWVRGVLLIQFVNLQTEPVMPMSIDILSGYVETVEGISYEIEETSGFLSPDGSPKTFIIDPLNGQTIPSSLPLLPQVYIQYKYAEAATPTKLVLNTNFGEIYINIPLFDNTTEPFQQNIISYASQQTHPLEELMSEFVFEISGSDQVQFDLQTNCMVWRKYKNSRGLGFVFSIKNNNSFNDETVFLSVTHPTFYRFEYSNGSSWGGSDEPTWHVENDLVESFRRGNINKGEFLSITLGPGQTSEGVYLVVPDGFNSDFYLLPRGDGLYNLYQPRLCDGQYQFPQ